MKNETFINQNLGTQWGNTNESTKNVYLSMWTQNKNNIKKKIKLDLECVL